MNIIDCTQGSAEWLEARKGRVTASRVADAISFLKRGEKQGQESAARAAYKAEIVAEILSGTCSDHYVSPWMERGTALEPIARVAYEMRRDVMVEQVGFVVHPSIDRAGCSPDGIVPGVRGVEFKCPKIETHLDYMLAGVLPKEYEPQVMFNLACFPEMPEWDFISFCPELPERHRMFCVPVKRDERRIAEIEAGACMFLKEVDELIERLNTLNPEPEQFKRNLRASLEDDPMALGDAEYRILMRGVHA